MLSLFLYNGPCSIHVGVLGEEFVEIDGLGVHVDLPGEEADGFGEAADRVNIRLTRGFES